MMVEDLPHRRRTCSTSAASSAGCDLSYAGGGACELLEEERVRGREDPGAIHRALGLLGPDWLGAECAESKFWSF
jgi:hypothetical protein